MARHWMLDYNDERPHDSLGNLPPSVYRQTDLLPKNWTTVN
ncbi:MAG: integrase core domain-containing protein [Gammaproteobacteria bacterium]|nr:integrase core domain-containing protein [Gammaproteobacteria bacterium]